MHTTALALSAAQKLDDGLDRVVGEYDHPVAACYPARDQMMRDCVGTCLELIIGNAMLAAHQRHLSTEMTGGVDQVIVQKRYSDHAS